MKDVLLLIRHFFEPLPYDIQKCKDIILKYFPVIYDTKVFIIYNSLYQLILVN